MENSSPAPKTRSKTLNVILLIVVLALFTAWLSFTPPGLDGKLHAAGYSVCHQIESHSLTVGGKVLPLCARCTGTFLGLLITFVFLSNRKNRGGAPSKGKIALLSLFFAAFALDGINSSLTLLPGVIPLYPPDNRLRLFTGLLFGISLANLVLPLWNQTLYFDWENKPILETWKQVLALVVLAAAAGLMILLDIPILYYPIAFFSTGTIFVILSMVYTLLWCIIFKKENSLHQFKDGIRILSIGMISAILQVGIMDIARWMITKTW